jgi:hypothetical protein
MIGNSTGSKTTGAFFRAYTECQNNSISLGENVAVTVLAPAERAYGAFVNNSTVDITLVLAPKNKAALNKGIIIKGFGGSYEINQINLYQGAVSAIAEKACVLSFVECI